MRTAALAAIVLAATFSILLPRPTSMRSTAILLVLLTAATSACLSFASSVQPEKPPPIVVRSEGPTVEKLERPVGGGKRVGFCLAIGGCPHGTSRRASACLGCA